MTDKNVRARYNDLQFDVDCSIRYHSRRRRFFENVQQMALFVGFVFASGALAKMLEFVAYDWLTHGASLIGTVILGLTIVSRASGKATDHNDLKRRFIRLQQQMELNRREPTDEDVAKWWAERLAIEGDEPPVNKVVHALCYNDLIRSMAGRELKAPRYVTVKLRHRVFGWATRAFDGSLKLGEPVKESF